MNVLLIGGPKDGEIVALPSDARVYKVAGCAYWIRFVLGDWHVFVVALPDDLDLSDDEILDEIHRAGHRGLLL